MTHRERKNFIEKEEKQTLIEEREIITEIKEEQGCSCKECCSGYKACLDSTFLGTRACIITVRKAICACLGTCFFPIKERCCNCCDDIDKDLNPYKNPNYNPYDHL